MRAPARRGRDEAGQAIVIFALALSMLLVGAGLGVDAGLLYVERRHEQVAADSAAFAAAVELVKHWAEPGRATFARDAALAYSATNGYNNDGATNTITVNIPPASGAFAGNADYAEVIVSVSVRSAFMRILGPSFEARQVQARAVGGITPPVKPYAIMALSKSAAPGLLANGNAEIEAEGAGILVNSSASGAACGADALQAIGNVEIEVEGGGIDVAGGVCTTGNPEIRPAPLTGTAPQVDPLAYLQPPSTSGLPTFPAVHVTGGEVVLSPGVYPSIDVSGNGKIKLRPGIFVLLGGGMSATGNGEIEDQTHGDGQGVLIFNACSNFPGPGGTCGSIRVEGNGRIELEETLSGPFTGVSIFQPCENTSPMTIDGFGAHPRHGEHGFDDERGELETDGTVYLPCAEVRVTGKGELEIENGQLVANTVTASGNAEIEVEWGNAVSGTSKVPSIVE